MQTMSLVGVKRTRFALAAKGSFDGPYLEPNGFLRVDLQHGSSFLDLTRRHVVYNFHLHQIITAKFAIDGGCVAIFKKSWEGPSLLRRENN